jgi:hypothetical protein
MVDNLEVRFSRGRKINKTLGFTNLSMECGMICKFYSLIIVFIHIMYIV